MKKIKMILIDFDGVVSKNALKIILQASHRIMNKFTPMPIEAMRQGLITASCQAPALNAKLSFETLGLSEQQMNEYFMELIKVNEFNGEVIKVEDDFFPFINFCDENQIAYKVFSTGSLEMQRFKPVVSKLGEELFYNLNNKHKSAPQTYMELVEESGLDPEEILHVDDSPLALRTSKICGIKTVMMLNEIFDDSQYEIFKEFIDVKVTSFDQLQEYIMSL